MNIVIRAVLGSGTEQSVGSRTALASALFLVSLENFSRPLRLLFQEEDACGCLDLSEDSLVVSSFLLHLLHHSVYEDTGRFSQFGRSPSSLPSCDLGGHLSFPVVFLGYMCPIYLCRDC